MQWFRMTGIGLVVLGCAFLSSQHASAGPAEDAATTARIETTFALNGHLSPFDINTTTREGVVTLTGSVDDQVQKDLCTEIAMTVAGVKEVDNQLLIVDDITVDAPKRTWQQKVEDATVTASVRTRILYNKEFSAFNIKVSTVDNVVTLSGVVDKVAQIERIGEIAAETQGVTKVINNLSFHQRNSLDPVQNVGRQFSDEWIEKRVETSLALNRHVSVRDLAVEVEDGVCILGGTVDTDNQRAVAETIAVNINGVLSVQNNIKVHEVQIETLDPVDVPEPAPAKP